MEKHCEFCGVLIEGLVRITKKYCSDNCKQLAFYARQGMNWGKNADKFSPAQSVPFNVKPQAKPSFTLNGNSDSAPENIREVELVSEDKMEKPQQEKTDSVKDFTVNDKERNGTKGADALPAQEQQQETNSVKQETKPKYKWIPSPLLEKICQKTEQYNIHYDAENAFREPWRYWQGDTRACVSWTNQHLRCLAENILRLSNYGIVDRETVLKIQKAFSSMTGSVFFKGLPLNYPFAGLVRELRDKFERMVTTNFSNEVSLRLSFDMKAELITVRFLIGNSVDKAKFSELSFKDPFQEADEERERLRKEKEEAEEDEDEDQEDKKSSKRKPGDFEATLRRMRAVADGLK